jgi:hypothetical protein
MNRLHKLNFIALIGFFITLLSGALGLLYKWGDIAEGMTNMHSIYVNAPAMDSLVKQAPSMRRLIKDYEIIHGLIEEKFIHEERIDSLETLIDILTYGKAPFQDTIWYMNEYGQWIKCHILEHPKLKQ